MKSILIILLITVISYAWDPPDTVWTKCYELDNCCCECYVLNCENGNYLLGGSASATLFINPRATLMEISSAGDVNWVQEYNSTLGTQSAAISVVIEKADGYILAGFWGGAAGNDNYFLLEVDFDGEPQSYTISNFPEDDWFINGIETADGGYAFCGALDDQMYLAKFDSNLVLEWDGSYGSSSFNNWAYQLTETSDGGFVLAGDLAISVAMPMSFYNLI